MQPIIYSDITKPNHWKIIKLIEEKKVLLNQSRKEYQVIEDRITVNDISRELKMAKQNVRKYLQELEEIGYINTCRIGRRMEVILL